MAISDVLTIVGILCAIGLQTLAGYRWLVKQFEIRDEAVKEAVRDRNRELNETRGRIDSVRELSRSQVARVDRDMANLRERLAVMPSRKDLEDVIRERVRPMESDLRALVIELARLGVHRPRLPSTDLHIKKGTQQWD